MDSEHRCEYEPCGKRARYLVNARYRQASLSVCGRHLSPEVTNAMTFDDPRYKRRVSDNGVRVYPIH